MRNKIIYILFLAIFAGTITTFAQMVGDNVFLQGAFVELGIAPNGGFGSTLNAPAGYHPNNPGGDFFYDPAAGTATSLSSNLGFVADYGADGWAAGSPPFFGDFYLPGDPQEGWAIEVDGVESDAYIPSYESDPTTGFTGFGAASPGGGLSGTNLSYSNSGGIIRGVWLGKDTTADGGRLTIRQTTTLDTNKLYFTVNVILTNTGSTTLNNIHYLRTVDPDNDETYSGDYTTINTIVDQLPDAGNKVLVQATGTVYTNAYLGLGTKDCRAKCMIYSSGLTPDYSVDSLYDDLPGLGYTYIMGSEYTADVGIGLVFNIGALGPGDSTSLSYAYILNATYIDSALNSTEPAYFVNTVAFDSVDTINACSYPYDTVAVNIQNGGFYTWSWAPDSFLLSPTGPSNVIYSDSVTNFITYTITGTNTSGGCDSIVYHLTIEHAPAPGPVLAPVNYCQYATADTLSATVGHATWFNTPTGGVGSSTAPTPSTAFPGTTIYYLLDSNGFCVSLNRSPDTVNVIALPAPPIITDPNPYCQGSPFVPYTSSVPTTLWYAAPTGGTGSTTAPTVNTGVPGTYTFYASDTVVTAVPDNSFLSCESPRIPVTTTVLDSIIPGFTYDIHYGCTSDTVVFTNTTTGALNYSWTFGDYGNDTNANPSHVYYTQGTFTVNLTALNNSCVALDSQAISISHSLIASFTDTPGIVCQNSPIAFNNTSSGVGLSYMWYFGNGATDTSFSPTYTYANSGVYTVMYVVKDFVPCYDTVTATVYVDTQSQMSFQLSDSTICQGSYITFTGLYSPVGNTGETWYFGNGDSIRNDNPVSYAYPEPGVYTATVTAFYRACLAAGTTRVITVEPQPVINLGNDTSICAGSGAITLTDLVNAGNPAASWVWNTGQTTPSVLISNPGEYYATVNVNNCFASDSVQVLNDCYMDIPNAFTPNNDGVNDYFYPRQLLTRGLVTFNMNIYNRWGELIFQTNSLDGAGWDGKLNGVDQPEGVFIYVIDATFKDGQKEHHQGNVTLLR